jgi:hypothetical protein
MFVQRPAPPRNSMYDLAGSPGWRDFRASGRAYRARLFRDDVEALERRLEEPYLEKRV